MSCPHMFALSSSTRAEQRRKKHILFEQQLYRNADRVDGSVVLGWCSMVPRWREDVTLNESSSHVQHDRAGAA